MSQRKQRSRGKQQKTKGCSTSFGLACLRYNKENELEILLVKKRCTYMYASFLNGLYKKKDTLYINAMFNGMTQCEKADILTLDYEKMWFRMYSYVPQKIEHKKFDIKMSAKSTTDTYEYIKSYNSYYELYAKKKRKFESLFFYENSTYLENLVNNSACGVIKWEIPRGKKEKGENTLDCAIREFKEETGVNVNDYNILFGIDPIIDSYISSGVQYIHSYYIAVDKGLVSPIINGGSEISESQWLNVNSLKYMKSHSYIHGLVKNIVHRYTSYVSNE